MSGFSIERPIAIIGTGVIGAKVAWAAAQAGIATRLHDLDPARAVRARDEAIGMDAKAAERVADRLSVAPALDAALDGVQLAFENVPERLELKCRIHADIGARLDPLAYQGSNTSSLLCTPLANASGRPERFFNMNFSDPRETRLVELMGGEATGEAALAFARSWAKAMGLVTIEVRREQMGYSFNRLWRAIKKEVLRQIGDGVTTAADIDRAWMLSYGLPIGPCGMMDEVGLATVLAIEEAYAAASGDPADRPPAFLRQMVDSGALGVGAGRGFYDYPDPTFRRPSFTMAG